MSAKDSDKPYTDKVTERRATEALRRALAMPYKPQREMVGKSGRPSKRKTKNENPAKP